jgi:phosphoribosyl-ATP pyrophosphohydrolase/phosphoribosyl-AMP cyclohydrolase
MNIDFNKGEGLVPVIIQNTITSQVLMLGYMNQEAYEKTVEDGVVTFFSRSKNRLWTKGETSGNTLKVDSISLDCDNDSILIQAFPAGPTCHTGTTSCFKNDSSKGFLYDLEQTISDRIESKDPNSYTNQLVNRGINKVAQKVGEEAVEVVIEAKDSNDELFKNEVSDLLYHTLILLKVKNVKLSEIEAVLKARKK